jgi:predicted N-formylglutamate amidohydrolase
MHGHPSLLGTDDPPPVTVTNPRGRSSFLLVADHAGRCVPAGLGDLGVGPADWDRHIAWDIGIAGVCAALAPLLDAVCIEQVYSRLVIDCNRRPGHPTSIPPASDGTVVPGNQNLTEADKAARVEAIFSPYHDAIAAEIDRRTALGQPTILIAMHSFTPVWGGIPRIWQAGVLHNRDPRLGHALAAQLTAAGYHVGDNEPYSLSDESDYTVPVHAERRNLPYVELEIRQDLIVGPQGQAHWATLLAKTLPAAWQACGLEPGAAGGD